MFFNDYHEIFALKQTMGLVFTEGCLVNKHILQEFIYKETRSEVSEENIWSIPFQLFDFQEMVGVKTISWELKNILILVIVITPKKDEWYTRILNYSQSTTIVLGIHPETSIQIYQKTP